MKRWIWPSLLSLAAVACKGEQSQIGVEEPFRVTATPATAPAAQFIKGKLPGTPPPTGTGHPMTPSHVDGGGSAEGGPEPPPHVVEFTTPSVVYQGEGGVGIKGSATENAFSVGFQLEGVGTGYWVVSVTDADPQTRLRPWQFSADFDESIPAGYRKLLGVAFDQDGKAGQQLAQRICIGNHIPDNLNSCPNGSGHAPAPPDAIIALTWDTNVDLDLQVLTPSGRLVEPKRPLLTDLDATAAKKLAGPPARFDGIDRDSNAGCVVDNIREEDLVFYNGKPHGQYQIFVNLFDACKQPVVHFRVEIWSSADLPDGGKHLVRYYPRDVDPQGGELLDISANGGSARGLFLTAFNFN